MFAMPDERLIYLFDRYLAGTCTAGEKLEFSERILASQNDAEVQELLQNAWNNTKGEFEIPGDRAEQIIDAILAKPGASVRESKVRVMFPRRRWFAIAAAVIMLVVAGYWWWQEKAASNGKQEIAREKERFKNDVTPGIDKAVLVMADGNEIVLEGKGKQTLTDKDGSLATNDNGHISYSDIKVKPGETVYHTLRVPRKGQYELLLNDGSRVKLNAESSIKYPTVFLGDERKVEITGEAYFEVAKDYNKPFFVLAKGMEIKVLGTHFNINAYDNETVIRTTLVEGSVEVSNKGKSVTIAPGQQAVIQQNRDEIAVVNEANMEEVLAWTTGFFNFNNADIETIMRQVERWYDVDVVFEGKVEQRFVAEIPRNVNASDFFRILEATGWVHFSIEGRKVVVMK